MATRWAVKAGNWSDPTLWNGGTLPATTDDVYSNGFAVTIDISVTVNMLRTINSSSPVINLGGSFILNGVDLTVSAGIEAQRDAGVNNSAMIFVSALNTSTINTPYILGGSTLGSNRRVVHIDASNARLIVNAGYINNTLQADSVIRGGVTSTHVTVNADLLGSGNCVVSHNGANSTTIINGNITGCSGINSGTVQFVNTGTAVITGDVIGSLTTNSAFGVRVLGGIDLTINGNLKGGTTGSSSYAVDVSNLQAVVKLNGTFRCGNYNLNYGSPAVGVTNGNVWLTGNIYAGGIEQFTGPLGAFPIFGMFHKGSSPLYIHLFKNDLYPSAGGSTTVLTDSGINLPAESDVRQGTSYQQGARVGTLKVPPANSVASGVPVDNTVGSAALKLTDVAAVTGSQLEATFPKEG